ncbi:hypothetical protein G5V59_26415 [Nocardioides sp. W3-2-3]|uniref:hypothetical protein n=1 Tax=Nocardioides convexus TaxID=2712224 RepID=UPI0024182E14|nr:hypothetical protein [Nocardioides convexus]NHA01965.1 hypothetical protein [Nocardioides convexus]
MSTHEIRTRIRAQAREHLPAPVVERIRNRGSRSTLLDRVAALEAEVQENRQAQPAHRRVSPTSSPSLLIPLEARDQAKVDEVLARYKQGL